MATIMTGSDKHHKIPNLVPQQYQTIRVSSLNKDKRKKDQIKISIENQAILKRLQAS
jgi:hypothetical protein